MRRLSLTGFVIATLAIGAVSLDPALFGGTTLFGGHVSADEDDGEELIELEDVEDVLEAFEALATQLVSPASALESLAATQSGTPIEMELTAVKGDGTLTPAWEVLLVQDDGIREWTLDARTGAVVGSEVEADLEAGRAQLLLAQRAKHSLAAAAAVIARDFEGAVTAVELEIEDGVAGWEIALVHGGRLRELMVDGASGKTSIDDEDEDDDDA